MADKITITSSRDILCGEVQADFTTSNIPSFPFSLDTNHNITCVDFNEKYGSTPVSYNKSTGVMDIGGEIFEDGQMYIYAPSFTFANNICSVYNPNEFPVTLEYRETTSLYDDMETLYVNRESTSTVFSFSESGAVQGFFRYEVSAGKYIYSKITNATFTYTEPST